MRRPHKYHYQFRNFRCTECGFVTPAGKRRSETQPGHRKQMHCCRCRKETEHVQVEEFQE